MVEISDAALDAWYGRSYVGFYDYDPDETDPYGCDEADEEEQEE